jgi:Tfp pilus assembly protein PilO
MKLCFFGNRKGITILAGVLALEVLLALTVIMFASRWRSTQAAALTQAQQDLSILIAEANQLPYLRMQTVEYQDRLRRLEAPLPPGRGGRLVPTIMVQLYELAGSTGVTVGSVRPTLVKQTASAKEADKTTFETSKIGLDLQGTFAQLHAFLDGLSYFPKPVEITNIQLRPLDRTAGRVPRLGINVELTCHTIYREEQKGEAGEG